MARKRMNGKSGGGVPALAPTPSGPMLSKERDYQAEDDFRTMERGEEVRADKARHARALDHGHRKLAAITRVIAKSVGTRNGKRKLSRVTAGGRR